MAFEKSPSFPNRSCSFPSSIIWRKTSKTEGWAFSISSNKTIE
jgi:hypothetical protein